MVFFSIRLYTDKKTGSKCEPWGMGIFKLNSFFFSVHIIKFRYHKVMFWIINALKILFYFILYFDSSFFSSIFFLQGVPDIIMWILSSLITSLFSYLHTAQYHSKRPFKIPIYCAYNIALYSRELKNNIYTHNPLFMLAFQCVLYILYKQSFICALKRIFFFWQ